MKKRTPRKVRKGAISPSCCRAAHGSEPWPSSEAAMWRAEALVHIPNQYRLHNPPQTLSLAEFPMLWLCISRRKVG
jgi:hypothetical protein